MALPSCPATAGNWAYVYRAGLVLVIAGYYALNWLRSGQTLGMRAWRLRTVSASGQPLTWSAVFLRECFGLHRVGAGGIGRAVAVPRPRTFGLA